MATLTKLRARRSIAAGPVSPGWANYASPGLMTNRHLNLMIGDYMLRVEEGKAKELAENMLRMIEEHKSA